MHTWLSLLNSQMPSKWVRAGWCGGQTMTSLVTHFSSRWNRSRVTHTRCSYIHRPERRGTMQPPMDCSSKKNLAFLNICSFLLNELTESYNQQKHNPPPQKKRRRRKRPSPGYLLNGFRCDAVSMVELHVVRRGQEVAK